ncbi:uncharacterized protein LOC131951411 [Physella acuta]|uniref:uncharacterized protein LOC131951411 n=1 Tax=Physella acuta TaxID=109671 RepID=UPI0027DE2B81|nr:uncharacterized protein LOC131951411 [Physella acuta]
MVQADGFRLLTLACLVHVAVGLPVTNQDSRQLTADPRASESLMKSDPTNHKSEPLKTHSSPDRSFTKQVLRGVFEELRRRPELREGILQEGILQEKQDGIQQGLARADNVAENVESDLQDVQQNSGVKLEDQGQANIPNNILGVKRKLKENGEPNQGLAQQQTAHNSDAETTKQDDTSPKAKEQTKGKELRERPKGKQLLETGDSPADYYYVYYMDKLDPDSVNKPDYYYFYYVNGEEPETEKNVKAKGTRGRATTVTPDMGKMQASKVLAAPTPAPPAGEASDSASSAAKELNVESDLEKLQG